MLGRSQYYSINEFLENNNEFIEVGKLFITYILKKYEDESKLFLPNNPGWCQELFTALITDDFEQIQKNSIGIITYNYDKSLECCFHNAIKAIYRIDNSKAIEILKKLPIIHMHGIIGIYPKYNYTNSEDYKTLKEISEGIKIIYELEESDRDFCSIEYQQAYELL